MNIDSHDHKITDTSYWYDKDRDKTFISVNAILKTGKDFHDLIEAEGDLSNSPKIRDLFTNLVLSGIPS